MEHCKNCGKELEKGAQICDNCQTKVETQSEPVAEQNVTIPVGDADNAEQPAGKKKSKKTKHLLSIIILSVTVVAVVALAIFLLPKLLRRIPTGAVYLKNNELYATRLSKIQPIRVTSDLLNGKELPEGDIGEFAKGLTWYTYLTEDGRTLFYPDKWNPDDDGMTIYYRDIKNPDADPQKVDSDIREYIISRDGYRVIYEKVDGSLFRYNQNEKEKIASNLYSIGDSWFASEDCKRLIYCVANKDNGYVSVYAQTEGGEKEKLTSDCKELVYVSSDCKTVYYINSENELYIAEVDEDKEKIDSDVTNVMMVYESGEIYYTVDDGENEPMLANRFVVDDVKNSPDSSKYNALRKKLVDLTIFAPSDIVCYYDGDETHKLSDKVYYSIGGVVAMVPHAVSMDKPVLVFSECKLDQVEKVKLSELDGLTEDYEIIQKIAAAAGKANAVYIAVEENLTKVDCNQSVDAWGFSVNKDGKAAYYCDSNEDLYKVAIDGSKVKAPELYDSEINQGINLLDNDLLVYFKDVSEKEDTWTGDLYINKKLVEYDVDLYHDSYEYNPYTEQVFLFTDDVLKVWESDKVTDVAEDVYQVQFAGENLLYIADYDTEKREGTLYQFKNGDSKKVDDDVTCIIGYHCIYGKTYQQTVYEDWYGYGY